MTRLDRIYIALQRLDSREIMRKVIEKDYTEYGDDNALLQELAKIVDVALADHVKDATESG